MTITFKFYIVVNKIYVGIFRAFDNMRDIKDIREIYVICYTEEHVFVFY